MSNNLYLASFIALVSACAPAEKPAVTAPRQPAPGTCTADRRVLFQMTVRPSSQMYRDPSVVRLAATVTTLHEGGTWEVSGLGGVRTGCAPNGVVAIIREDLARASWKVGSDGVPCDAMGTTVTDYVAFGKPVFTAEICSMRVLDADSSKILSRTVNRLNEVSRPAPVACKGAASLIQVSHRVDGAVSPRTWEADVSTDGLVTFAGQNPEEHRTACLTVDELAQIQQALAKMTWKSLPSVAMCAAFSPEHDVYTVGGKQVWDQRLCGDAMDADDTARLAEIRAIIDQATTRS